MMDVSLSSWLVICCAAAGGQPAFLNERVFGIDPDRAARKPFWLRLIELVVLYLSVGRGAYLLESRIGNVFTQRWEFYAVDRLSVHRAGVSRLRVPLPAQAPHG